jgi:alkanesulfonate monooxygenase SsuD/methylene tetrahydromethanopterin reductase-like flavin-dependent oxidoreductase (luciferase family)
MATGFANHAAVDDRRFIKEEFDLIRLGNELGYDSVWMTEHHFADYSLSPNPLQYLAYVSGFAPRMWLGTQVIVMPWWDPVRCAEQIAVLDHMSGGKAIIGFGRGLARIEFEGFGIDQGTARERFDAGVAMVMEAMETGFIEGDGRVFKHPRREIRPRPIRSLRGRTFAAVGTEGSARAAATLGIGRLYLNQPMVHSSQGQEAAKKHAEMVGKPGDPWYDVWVATHKDVPPPKPFMSNMTFVDESADRAWELARKYVAMTFRWAVKHYEMTSKHHGSIKGYESYSQIVMDPKDIDAAAENVAGLAIAGTAQQVLDKYMEKRKGVDPQGFMPHFHTGGMLFDEAAYNMRYFAKHCLPEMKSWQTPTTFEGPLAQAAE